jgi:hypothetical protein
MKRRMSTINKRRHAYIILIQRRIKMERKVTSKHISRIPFNNSCARWRVDEQGD